MTKDWILFLDDVRHPLDVLIGDELWRFRSDGRTFVWAKDVAMAKFAIEEWDCLPSLMLLDHDLGGEQASETTMDFLRWLERETKYCEHYLPPEYKVHSANPVGKGNIVSFMESWCKSLEVNDEE